MQRFFGHDALNNVRMDTHIEGDLPNIVLGSKISISDYHENYKRVSPGMVDLSASFVSRYLISF